MLDSNTCPVVSPGAEFTPARAVAVGRTLTAAERSQFEGSPTAYGPRAVDWSECPLAARFAPDYVRRSAKPVATTAQRLRSTHGGRFVALP